MGRAIAAFFSFLFSSASPLALIACIHNNVHYALICILDDPVQRFPSRIQHLRALSRTPGLDTCMPTPTTLKLQHQPDRTMPLMLTAQIPRQCSPGSKEWLAEHVQLSHLDLKDGFVKEHHEISDDPQHFAGVCGIVPLPKVLGHLLHLCCHLLLKLLQNRSAHQLADIVGAAGRHLRHPSQLRLSPPAACTEICIKLL